jgi:hypothetical protein
MQGCAVDSDLAAKERRDEELNTRENELRGKILPMQKFLDEYRQLLNKHFKNNEHFREWSLDYQLEAIKNASELKNEISALEDLTGENWGSE